MGRGWLRSVHAVLGSTGTSSCSKANASAYVWSRINDVVSPTPLTYVDTAAVAYKQHTAVTTRWPQSPQYISSPSPPHSSRPSTPPLTTIHTPQPI